MRLEDITVEDALRGLREAVAERGKDYVYRKPVRVSGPDCLYSHGDEPGCIVGLALFKLGAATLDDLRAWDNPVHSDTGIGELDLPLQASVGELFQFAQFRQDINQPWGAVLATAEEYAKKLRASV